MSLKFLTKGKRGKIYVKENIAIKKSKQVHVQNEVKWLKILNNYNIGPKLLSSKKDRFSYTFIKGYFLPEWIENQGSKTKIKKVLRDVFLQCSQMDILKVNKLEMHNPYKHIIITNSDKPVLIDFERCYETPKPKNTTQFCQYLISMNFSKLLNSKSISINRRALITASRQYKKTYSRKDFSKVLSILRQS
ncbi:MAG: hypothetical protein KKG60_02185 [Nanoarchaeota archaeon]|nr:hypothetical protein [Nanoarchaeota archaeon]